MRHLLLALSMLLLAAGAAVASERHCALPDHLRGAGEGLPRLAERLAGNEELAVVAVGSTSSLPGGGSRLGRIATEAFLGAMARHFPGRRFAVSAVIDAKATAPEVVETEFPALVIGRPALVLWQTGGVDAMEHVDLHSFDEALRLGIAMIQQAGGDVLLLTPLFSVRSLAVTNMREYLNYIGFAAGSVGVPLLDRHAALRYWIDQGVVNPADDAARRSDAEFVHGCLGKLMADMVHAAVKNAR